MIDPVHDRRPPTSPQLALRVAMLGGVALVLFGIIFFRLWYLQILDGDRYLAQAQTNRVRLERIQAPRGAVVDRNGNTLIANRQATLVQLDVEQLPEEARVAALEWGQRVTQRLKRPKGERGPGVPIPPVATEELRILFERLGEVLGMSVDEIQRRTVQQIAQVPYARVTVKTDVPATQRDFIKERQEKFPGVEVSQKFLRRYPEGKLASQLVGTVGEISPEELEDERYRDVTQGTIIGKEGLERAYDRFLRGRDGATRIVVNAQGQNRGQGRAREPVVGRTVKLTLDLELQKAAQEALQRGIASAAGRGSRAGAFVAMDPRNGAILALGSAPDFDPNDLARPISQEAYDARYGDEAGAPRFNRAISASYPTGSIFKPITAFAGLAEGVQTPTSQINDSGCIEVGANNEPRCNAGKTAYGAVDMRRSLEVSSNIYYYLLGQRLDAIDGEPLQKWARQLGLGKTTGIDLPGEFGGLVPDRKWRERVGQEEAECRKRRKVRSCGISDMRPWTFGDNLNLAIGQGDLQATPLQMAVAYAAIANNGRIVRPHLGARVEDDEGRLVESLRQPPIERIDMNADHRAAIMAGLRDAASGGSGTSTDVFEGWPHGRFPVFGKTGTANVVNAQGQFEQSWYAAFVQHEKKPIVVVATIEKGGYGAATAAPAVRQILEQFYFGRVGEFTSGDSRTN